MKKVQSSWESENEKNNEILKLRKKEEDKRY